MNAPKVGETVKCLRTGALFEVRKVVNGFVIFQSQDGLTQIMTGAESVHFLFSRTTAEESPGRSFNPRPKSGPVADRLA